MRQPKSVPGIEIVLGGVSGAEALALYLESGWWEGAPAGAAGEAAAAEIVRRSVVFACAREGGRLVGMARAIGDGVSDAYIQDVFVTADSRDRGIGARLVEAVAAELRRRGVDWIGLVAEPGTEAFYARLGFAALSGHVPMRLRRP